MRTGPLTATNSRFRSNTASDGADHLLTSLQHSGRSRTSRGTFPDVSSRSTGGSAASLHAERPRAATATTVHSGRPGRTPTVGAACEWASRHERPRSVQRAATGHGWYAAEGARAADHATPRTEE